ncbi:hypothetical protein Tco_1244802 [Tanacetum coccineum]
MWPQSLPTAAAVGGGGAGSSSGSGSGGNRVPIDDVVDKVTNMGFPNPERSVQDTNDTDYIEVGPRCGNGFSIPVYISCNLHNCLIATVSNNHLGHYSRMYSYTLHLRNTKVSSMMASIEEDVEKSTLADQDDVGSGGSSSAQNKSRKYRDSSGSKTFDSDKKSITEEYLLEMSFNLVNKIKLLYLIGNQSCIRVTPSSRNSRSGDHRCSRRDSPEYDRREGRVVSRRYSDDRDYRDHLEPSPRHGRDNRDYDIKRSRYETSRRTPSIAQVQLASIL